MPWALRVTTRLRVVLAMILRDSGAPCCGKYVANGPLTPSEHRERAFFRNSMFQYLYIVKEPHPAEFGMFSGFGTCCFEKVIFIGTINEFLCANDSPFAVPGTVAQSLCYRRRRSASSYHATDAILLSLPPALSKSFPSLFSQS